MPITVILAASQLQSVSKDGLFYCQNSTVQPFPSLSHLNHMDLKIPAQGRGWRRKAGNRACCALAVTALLASSAPVSQQNETTSAVLSGKQPCHGWRVFLALWLAGLWEAWWDARRCPFSSDPPLHGQQGSPPAQGLAPGHGSHTTGLFQCQCLFE